MRTVLVILVLGLAAWGTYQLLPQSRVEGKEDVQDSRSIQFLTRDEESPSDLPDEQAPVVAEHELAGAAAPEGDGSVFGVSPDSAPSLGSQDERLARAVLFGDPASVERALGGIELDGAEGRLYRAFSLGLAGQRREGLALAKGLDTPGALADVDRDLLRAALTGRARATVRPASAAEESIVRRAMGLKLLEREAQARLDGGDHAAAAVAFSELLLAALGGPWEPERLSLLAWSDGLNRAQAGHRWDPRGTWPAVEMQVESGESLTVIRARYLQDHPDGLLCTGMIEKANQLTGYIHPGDTLKVPTDHAWALVDLSSRWMLYMLAGEVAGAWEVGIGRLGEETILGDFRAAEKQKDPTWFRRGEEPLYFPDNPLGTRWIAWFRDGQKTGYGFHGTWEPESVGMASSDGCVRLRNEEVESLFQILPVGARIRVQE